jgi:ubiquinone/menaquinone biosynthesis C-methylase UbiE
MLGAVSVTEYRNRILDKAFSKLALVHSDIIADIGCGDGGDCALLLHKATQVVGMDIEPNPNWREKHKGKVAYLIGDAANLQFVDTGFDLVFEKDMLHHVTDPLKVLKELFRVTKKGGYLICVEGNRYNPILYFHMTMLNGHEHFTKAFLRKLVSQVTEDFILFSTESHVYPADKKFILNFVYAFNNMLEVVPFLRDYLSYNIVIVRKA